MRRKGYYSRRAATGARAGLPSNPIIAKFLNNEPLTDAEYQEFQTMVRDNPRIAQALGLGTPAIGAQSEPAVDQALQAQNYSRIASPGGHKQSGQDYSTALRREGRLGLQSGMGRVQMNRDGSVTMRGFGKFRRGEKTYNPDEVAWMLQRQASGATGGQDAKDIYAEYLRRQDADAAMAQAAAQQEAAMAQAEEVRNAAARIGVAYIPGMSMAQLQDYAIKVAEKQQADAIAYANERAKYGITPQDEVSPEDWAAIVAGKKYWGRDPRMTKKYKQGYDQAFADYEAAKIKPADWEKFRQEHARRVAAVPKGAYDDPNYIPKREQDLTNRERKIQDMQTKYEQQMARDEEKRKIREEYTAKMAEKADEARKLREEQMKMQAEMNKMRAQIERAKAADDYVRDRKREYNDQIKAVGKKNYGDTDDAEKLRQADIDKLGEFDEEKHRNAYYQRFDENVPGIKPPPAPQPVPTAETAAVPAEAVPVAELPVEEVAPEEVAPEEVAGRGEAPLPAETPPPVPVEEWRKLTVPLG